MYDPQALMLGTAIVAALFLIGYRLGRAEGEVHACRRGLDDRLHGMDRRTERALTVAGDAQRAGTALQRRVEGAGEMIENLHQRVQHLEETALTGQDLLSHDLLRRPLITPGPSRTRAGDDDTGR